MASAWKERALPTLRTLVLFFWCPFSEMSDEIPTAFSRVNVGIKANDKGMLSESSHKCSPPLSTHDARTRTHTHTHTHTHTPLKPADGAQETSGSGCCLHSYSSNAIWFSSLMASESLGVDRWPHRFRLGS